MFFDTTPSIPTYLVCWSIGEYEFVGDKTKDGTDIAVRVFTMILVCNATSVVFASIAASGSAGSRNGPGYRWGSCPASG